MSKEKEGTVFLESERREMVRGRRAPVNLPP
jgi:hypothetical protein